MTDNFNFLGLPLVVQDLITNEIVHDSIPEDRIQLALTSKFCNGLVQHARPRKIIDQFWIQFPRYTLTVDSRKYTKTKEQLMEMLPHCQIKQLELINNSNEDYLEILGMLFEAARFATKLDISMKPVHMDKIVEFYVKMKHLKSVTLRNPELIFPYYPSKVALKFGNCNPPENFLEDLAKKSQNCPLSFFEMISRATLEKCQQFLQTANFSIGADIFFRNYFDFVPLHLTYLDQNTFTLEIFSNNSLPTFINQKYVGKYSRILKLKKLFNSEFTFNVVSVSNPEKNYYSDVFKKFEQRMLINLENIDRDEILLVKFESIKEDLVYFENFVRPVYSASMLKSAFPTANFTTPEERVEKINNVLGTNIHLIQADNFAQSCRALFARFIDM